MFLQSLEIDAKSSPAEIVKKDYRTADVFRKYGLEYCCNGRWPLEGLCEQHGIDMQTLIRDLNKATRPCQAPAPDFEKWSCDFLIDYIINIHHQYLHRTLPGLRGNLDRFMKEHVDRYPQYNLVEYHFTQLEKDIFPHIQQEEEVIFPYLRQVAHAYEDKDSLAGLLVKTLRKPLGKMMDHEHELLRNSIYKFRELTGNYIFPPNACVSHQVILSKLKELDHDLVQHVYLENEVLFPRIIAMEKELLGE